MKKWDKSKKKLWDDFKARSRAIEVLYQPKEGDKKILTKVYFDFDPLASLPWKTIKEKMLYPLITG